MIRRLCTFGVCTPMKFFLTIIVWLLGAAMSGLWSQREYHIRPTEKAPVIDGHLDEEVWQGAEVATDFTVKSPVFGEKSRFETKVRLLYDNDALYIGGEFFDPNPDSVSFALSTRDDEGNADWFGIVIDTYGNNTGAFDFMVTSAGVELDALEEVNSIDYAWNAVWKSVAIRRDFGWSVEMKIPYSALRFPNKPVQEWNINFWRSVRRTRENSTWNPINPQIFGEITQSGKLLGIENIKSPVRLALIPYATGYVENSYDETLDRQTWKRRVTGGMDLKYGLNDAFTLDMSLIPDFGQTTSDRKVLNLGPFEVRFDENRPFFLEGTDLFKAGGIFYSRRVASTPFNYDKPYEELDESKGEQVVANPDQAPMINGTKISGRTKSGLGIGVFNAVEGRTDAIIADSLGNERRVTTNPLTNYNAVVFSQNLRNNSKVSLVNTHVFREGDARDANVTAGSASIFTPDGKFNISGSVNISGIMEDGKITYGHLTEAYIGKVAGTWQYGFLYGEQSNTYDPNDLGFLYANNSRYYSVDYSWNHFRPSKHFFRRFASLNVYYEELYKPQLFSYLYITAQVGGLHKKQLYTYLQASVSPVGEVNHFESRTFGKEVLFQPSVEFDYLFSSDYSKRFALDGYFWFKNYFGTEQHGGGVSLGPRVRISDRINVVLEMAGSILRDDYGYVSLQDEAYDGEIMLGVRDRVIVENNLRMQLTFTRRMGIDVRVRHYWQEVLYDHFMHLLDHGQTETTAYNPLQEDGSSAHNTSYNAFTVDVNYRWVFIPGSELRIVYKNNIFNSKEQLDYNYFSTYRTLFDQPQINSISMKLLVYVDVLYFRKKGRK